MQAICIRNNDNNNIKNCVSFSFFFFENAFHASLDRNAVRRTNQYTKSDVFLAVVPKFELVIDPPRYIRDLNTCEQATVRAR